MQVGVNENMQNPKQYFVVANNELLGSATGELMTISEHELSRLNVHVFLQQAMVVNHSEQVFVAGVIQQDILGYRWLNLRSQVGLVTDDRFQLAGRALQMLRWHLDHQYCGRCGKPTVQHLSDIAKTCVKCSLDFYPRLSPCIITLVAKGDYCLLARHAKSKTETYSCLAGFIEIGESPEQTVAREVMEEVSVGVSNIRYVTSQPWPFPGQLMLGYFADYASGDIMPDQNEILDADWYHYTALPKVPPSATISGRLINTYVQQRLVFNEG
jgi:NAD+ diphosphatase